MARFSLPRSSPVPFTVSRPQEVRPSLSRDWLQDKPHTATRDFFPTAVGSCTTPQEWVMPAACMLVTSTGHRPSVCSMPNWRSCIHRHDSCSSFVREHSIRKRGIPPVRSWSGIHPPWPNRSSRCRHPTRVLSPIAQIPLANAVSWCGSIAMAMRLAESVVRSTAETGLLRSHQMADISPWNRSGMEMPTSGCSSCREVSRAASPAIRPPIAAQNGHRMVDA